MDVDQSCRIMSFSIQSPSPHCRCARMTIFRLLKPSCRSTTGGQPAKPYPSVPREQASTTSILTNRYTLSNDRKHNVSPQ